MPYLWSAVAAVVALLALGGVAATLLGPLRRTRSVQTAAVTSIRDDVATLTARLAALRVRFERRRT